MIDNDEDPRSARRTFLKVGGATIGTTIGLAALGSAADATAATTGPDPVSQAAAATHVDRRTMHETGTFAKGLEMPAEARAFAQRQRGRINSEPVTESHRKAASAWLRKLQASGKTQAEIVDAVVARAVRIPNTWTLLVTQAALNELSRDPHTAALIRARVTPDVTHKVALASQRVPAARTEGN